MQICRLEKRSVSPAICAAKSALTLAISTLWVKKISKETIFGSDNSLDARGLKVFHQNAGCLPQVRSSIGLHFPLKFSPPPFALYGRIRVHLVDDVLAEVRASHLWDRDKRALTHVMRYSTVTSLRKAWQAIEQRSPLSVAKVLSCKYSPISGAVPTTLCFTRQQNRAVHSNKVSDISAKDKLLPIGFFRNFFNKIGILDIDKYRAMTLGCLLYEDIPDRIDYTTFYKEYNMPDTFLSWFLITELHVWMLMMRFMAEGKYGKFVRKHLVAAMWEDVSMRVTKLGPINKNVRSDQLTELFYQFNAAIIGYDEGIMSDDKVLAGALWRRFFRSECSNPEKLEQLLIYVRQQVNLLDNIPSQEAMSYPGIKWMYAKSTK
ncbi:hypothetical protein KM043_014335 [Ampulex compressa]|nr:hypothetical protein KM043_014335 [Ampulex compressa]